MSRTGNLNALKHGAFSQIVLLPNEDPEEFEELYASLKQEWNPQGPTQEDRIRTVAILKWRKLRFRRYLRMVLEEMHLLMQRRERMRIRLQDAAQKFLDGVESGAITSLSEENLEQHLNREWAILIRRHVPASISKDKNSAWFDAVIQFVFNANLDPAPEIYRKYSTEEFVEREMAFEERIDAAIAKNLREFCKLKTMQMMGLGGADQSAHQNQAEGSRPPQPKRVAIDLDGHE